MQKSDAVKLDIEQYRDLRNFLTDEYGIDTSNGLFVYEEERVDMGIKSYFSILRSTCYIAASEVVFMLKTDCYRRSNWCRENET